MAQFLYEQLDGAKKIGMQWLKTPEYASLHNRDTRTGTGEEQDFAVLMGQRFKNKKPLAFARGAYHIRGAPFYESENENEFREKLSDAIGT